MSYHNDFLRTYFSFAKSFSGRKTVVTQGVSIIYQRNSLIVSISIISMRVDFERMGRSSFCVRGEIGRRLCFVLGRPFHTGSRDQPDRGRMCFGEGRRLPVSAMGPSRLPFGTKHEELRAGALSPGSRDQPDRGRMGFGEGRRLPVSAMGPIAATVWNEERRTARWRVVSG